MDKAGFLLLKSDKFSGNNFGMPMTNRDLAEFLDLECILKRETTVQMCVRQNTSTGCAHGSLNTVRILT